MRRPTTYRMERRAPRATSRSRSHSLQAHRLRSPRPSWDGVPSLDPHSIDRRTLASCSLPAGDWLPRDQTGNRLWGICRHGRCCP